MFGDGAHAVSTPAPRGAGVDTPERVSVHGSRRDEGGVVSSSAGAVLLFDLDGYVSVFRSVEEAAAWMEPNDVLDGEYPAVFTLDGHVVTPTTAEPDRVTLTVTEERDEASLMHWLKESASRYGPASPADDVLAVANELLRREWQHRWPTRPRWLSRWLYGDGPTQL